MWGADDIKVSCPEYSLFSSPQTAADWCRHYQGNCRRDASVSHQHHYYYCCRCTKHKISHFHRYLFLSAPNNSCVRVTALQTYYHYYHATGDLLQHCRSHNTLASCWSDDVWPDVCKYWRQSFSFILSDRGCGECFVENVLIVDIRKLFVFRKPFILEARLGRRPRLRGWIPLLWTNTWYWFAPRNIKLFPRLEF